jgi:hypothetical protein
LGVFKNMQDMQDRAQGAMANQGGMAGMAAEDPAQKLERLGQMRDSGLITAEEFESKKKEILESI